MDLFDRLDDDPLLFSSPTVGKNIIGRKRGRVNEFSDDCSEYSLTDDDSVMQDEDLNELFQPLPKKARVQNHLHGGDVFLNLNFPLLEEEQKIPPPFFILQSQSEDHNIDFLKNEEFLIGSSFECHLQLRGMGDRVSPHHAKLVYDRFSGNVSIVPLSRKRVIWINKISYMQEYEISPNSNSCLKRIPLHIGDIITIGRTSFRFIRKTNFSNNVLFDFPQNNLFGDDEEEEEEEEEFGRMMYDEEDEDEQMIEFLRSEDRKRQQEIENDRDWNRGFDRVEEMRNEEWSTNKSLEFLADMMDDEEEDLEPGGRRGLNISAERGGKKRKRLDETEDGKFY